jgi:hypothetical protein
MPKLLTSTSKSRSRFTHLYPRDFKPASKGEKKKQNQGSRRGQETDTTTTTTTPGGSARQTLTLTLKSCKPTKGFIALFFHFLSRSLPFADFHSSDRYRSAICLPLSAVQLCGIAMVCLVSFRFSFFLSFFLFFLLVLEQILMGFVLTIMVVAGEVYFRRVAADHGQKTQHQEHVCDCPR